MKAVPYRQDFFDKLGEDNDKVQQQLKDWLAALENIIERLNNFYTEGGYDKGKF